LLLGEAEILRERGGAVRASEMNIQAPLTATAGSVPSLQPGCPAARAAASRFRRHAREIERLKAER
jgi:hypothetical protein